MESVSLTMAGQELREPESIDAVLDFQRELIDRRGECENADSGRSYWIQMAYVLTNGKVLQRSYSVPVPEDIAANSEGTLIRELETLVNLREAIQTRVSASIPVETANVLSAMIYYESVDDHGNWQGDYFPLTAEEAVELYEQGILPDARAGHIACEWLYENSPYYVQRTNCEFNLELRLPTSDPEGMLNGYAYSDWSSLYIGVDTDSENTLRWLREHTDIEIRTLRELEQQRPETDVPAMAWG